MRLSTFATVVVLITISLFFLYPVKMEAQTKGLQISVKDPTGKKVPLYSNSHALLIGVSKYTGGWPTLEAVPSEMQKLKISLIKNGFNVETVMDPDSRKLKGAFSSFIDRYGYDENNRLLFFYSGHGYSNKNNTKGYLVPVDAPDPREDKKGFRRKAFNMTHILALCKDMEAKHSLFLFDSCFSGTIFKTKALPKHPPHISSITASPVRQFISAGSAGEEVPAKSVFVPSFIRAIRGDADIDNDGYITGTELGMYLHRKVMSYETGQTPQYGKIKDPELDEGDFVFLLASSGATIEAPAESMGTASLSVEGNVSGASVFVDGRKVGTTPLSDTSVASGEHRIQVEKPGYEAYLKTIQLKNGRSMSLYVDLSTEAPQKGSLCVDTDPENARVRIMNTGPAFYQGIELEPGRYHLEISATGYETKKLWISLDASEDKTLDIHLGPLTTAMAAKKHVYSRRKVLKVALDADPVSLDPQVQLSGSMLQYSHWVFDPLVRFDQDMNLEPRLASRWERLDDYTMRFYLRKGVRFHSGNTFTAKDVKWTVARFDKSPDFRGLFSFLDTITVVDDYTVDIKTKKPYALLLNMATYIFPMDSEFYTGTDKNGQPKDAVVKIGPSFALMNESGTGAYKVTYLEQGVKTEFIGFADYWDEQSPGNIDKIVLTPIKEDATRVAALLSGDVDFISPVPPQYFSLIQKNGNVDLFTYSGGCIITGQLNQKRRAEFKDVRVRQAIAYAINNRGIVKKIMKGTATAAGQQGPVGYQGYKESLQPRYDLAMAKKLMNDAGLAKGFECTMIAPNNRYVNDEKIAEAVVSMLAKINIRVNLKTMPKAQYWDEFDAQAADIQMIGWHSDTEDSGNFTEFLGMCPTKETGYGQYNSGNYCNAKVDKLVIAAQSETDLTKRAKILQEVEQILYDEAAFIPFHWQNHSYAAKKDVLAKPIINTMNFLYFGDLVKD